MACSKDAVALLTFSPPQAKAWLYDLIDDANPATGIVLCRKHANATVVPMAWQLVDERDSMWTPPGEPAAPQPAPASIPGLLSEETILTEPLVELAPTPLPVAEAPQPSEPPPPPAPLPTTVQAEAQSAEPSAAPQQQPAPQPVAQVFSPEAVPGITYASEPAAVTPTVTAPSSSAAMPAAPRGGIAAAVVVAPPLPAPDVEPPVALTPLRSQMARAEATRVEMTRPQPSPADSHMLNLNEQIAAHARVVQPQEQWVAAQKPSGPPAASDLVANIKERLLPDPSLFELPLDAPAVTPHHGYR